MYKPRWMTDRLKLSDHVFPVLALTGARQTGKSTLLANEPMFTDYMHVTLDDWATLTQAHDDPEGFVRQAHRMVIDEAQRVPKLFVAVKKAVDDDRSRRFVLSGSANFLLLRQIHESLAGRAGYSVLRQPTWSEWYDTGKKPWLVDLFDGTLPPEHDTPPAPNIRTVLFTGALPGIRDAAPAEASLFWESYVRTYLERDLPSILAVASMMDYQAAMRMIAITTGSLLEYSSVASNTHVSSSTVGRYAETLRTAHLLDLISPAPLSSTASVRRSWKPYLFDTGLICSLLGKRTPDAIDDGLAGHLFEALVCMSLEVLAELDFLSLWFVRTRRGPPHEVDFVVERDRKKMAIEVKLSDRVSWLDTEHLRWYMSQDASCTVAVIVYAGARVVHLAKNIVAVPWTML
jgi:predicted AAA+ superfamily ATPase